MIKLVIATLFAVVAFLALALLQAAVFSWLWGLIVVPRFGLAQLGTLDCVGLIFMTRLVTPGLPFRRRNKS